MNTNLNETVNMADSALLHKLVDKCKVTYAIPQEAFENANVKRGLRNADGTGIMAGITKIGLVHGYVVNEGEKTAVEGKLYYRGYDMEELIRGYIAEGRYGFEECIYILLFGELPDRAQLDEFCSLLNAYRRLPQHFTEDVIWKAPNRNIMNKLASSILALYSYDGQPDDTSLENVFRQCIRIIAAIPMIAAHSYAVMRHTFDGESLNLHYPLDSLSTAQNFLRVVGSDGQFDEDDARLLDLCLIMHAEHGGGNNSAFACRVLSSSGTDTYSAISAAIGSLKGPKHGGANIKVEEMVADIKAHVADITDEGRVRDYLYKILNKQGGDGSGLIYGMGHAVYTISDPRAVIIKGYARDKAEKCGYSDEYELLEIIERNAPGMLYELKKSQPGTVCANIDLYSGLVYKMLHIPSELFTPVFAVARASGWCAHRIEELLTGGKIMRPAYKGLCTPMAYVPMEQR